jgi:hypothetical protein
VLIEGLTLEALDRACDAHLGQDALRRHGCAGGPARDTYSLQLAITKAGGNRCADTGEAGHRAPDVAKARAPSA